METSVQIIDISMLRHIPELVAWGIGIVLAVIMVRRGGLKLEKLFLAGCCLMFIAPLAGLLLHNWLTQLLRAQDTSYLEIAQSPLWITASVLMGLLSLAGLVCLIWAFLAKFRKKREAA